MFTKLFWHPNLHFLSSVIILNEECLKTYDNETNVIQKSLKKIKMLNAMIQRTVLSEAETQYIAVW